MKKIIIFIGLCLVSSFAFSQTLDDIGKIVIGVKILPTSTVETQNNKVFIQNKLMNLASNAGFTSYGNNAFYLIPSVSVLDIQNAEGGMKNIYVISGEIYLSVQEGDEGTVFASVSFPFKGSGKSKDAALKDGVQKISYGNLRPFFDDAKAQILNYYSAMQNKIFANADMLASNKEYDAAITCLLSIPEELFEPYQKAFSKACEIYRERDREIAEQKAIQIREENNAVLVKARSLMATHDAMGALRALWPYKVTGTSQDSEYNDLLQTAEARVSAEEQAALAKEQRDYEERRLKEERAYADSRQEYADEVNFRNRQFDLENKKIDYQRATQSEMTQAVKTVALEYIKKIAIVYFSTVFPQELAKVACRVWKRRSRRTMLKRQYPSVPWPFPPGCVRLPLRCSRSGSC